MDCNSFLQRTSSQVVSGDTMMHKARGPVWHAQHKAQGSIPEGLRGVDQEATWRNSHRDGWGYGPGPCCVVSHRPGVLGAFTYLRHRAHDAQRLWLETGPLRGVLTAVVMDGQADDHALLAELPRHRKMTRLTTPRTKRDHPEARPRLIPGRKLPVHRQRCRQRGQTGNPMQGVVKSRFARDRCGMRGSAITVGCARRWGAVPRPQARALHAQRSTWKITQEVVGL
jgi:hypothetical protein